MRPETAQDQHDEAMLNRDRSKIASKSEVEALMQQNAGSPPATSSRPRDLVEAVMQEYGVSREHALELIKEFGG